MNQGHYPFSLFLETFRSFWGRLILAYLTLYSAVLLGMWLYIWIEQPVFEEELEVDWHLNGWLSPLLIYPSLLLGGFSQLWGIPIYLFLLIFTLYFLRDHIRYRWLIIPFLLQLFETYRLLYTEYI